MMRQRLDRWVWIIVAVLLLIAGALGAWEMHVYRSMPSAEELGLMEPDFVEVIWFSKSETLIIVDYIGLFILAGIFSALIWTYNKEDSKKYVPLLFVQILFLLTFWYKMHFTLARDWERLLWYFQGATRWRYVLRIALHSILWTVYLFWQFHREEDSKGRLLGRVLTAVLLCSIPLLLSFKLLIDHLLLFGVLAVVLFCIAGLVLRIWTRPDDERLMDANTWRMLIVNGVVSAVCLGSIGLTRILF